MTARALACAALLAACNVKTAAEDKADEARAAWEADCRDAAVLLATTNGSPSEYACPNRLHRMRAQVATAPSNEEAAAPVLCECQRPEAAK